MIRSPLLACFCALTCLSSVAEARPRSLQKMQIVQGCADPVIRPCETSRASPRRRGRAALNRVESRGNRPRAWCLPLVQRGRI